MLENEKVTFKSASAFYITPSKNSNKEYALKMVFPDQKINRIVLLYSIKMENIN